jgi:hypothetical protein
MWIEYDGETSAKTGRTLTDSAMEARLEDHVAPVQERWTREEGQVLRHGRGSTLVSYYRHEENEPGAESGFAEMAGGMAVRVETELEVLKAVERRNRYTMLARVVEAREALTLALKCLRFVSGEEDDKQYAAALEKFRKDFPVEDCPPA